MSRLHLLSAAALVAALAACAAPQPRYPVRSDPLGTQPGTMAPIPNPPARPPVEPAPRAVPVPPVSSTTLPPPTAQPARPAPSVAVGGSRYTVAGGDTLFGIARRFGVTPSTLAAANNIAFDTRVQTGQRLALPLSARDGGPQAGASGSVSGVAPAQAVVRPAQEPRPSATPPLLPTPSATAQAGDVAAVGRGKFLWPIRGELLSEFGPKGQGQRNDGINIAASEGAEVKAAAGGEVVYAGDQVPGFGNLVLVKHPDGFVTAYAHLSRILVKNRQQIAQGFTLGEVGSSGGVGRPQLHFEVRYAPSPADKARPVDPLLVLPR